MTYTGKLINEDAQVSIEDGPILAVRGPNPIATAAGQFARWGQTQPVTVTGDPGTVDNISVVFVTNIQWAAQTAAAAAATADDTTDYPVETLSDTAMPPVTKTPASAASSNPPARKAQRKRQ